MAEGDEPTTAVVVVMTEGDVVVVRVEGGPPDIGIVHLLASLTLDLKRRGARCGSTSRHGSCPSSSTCAA